MSVDPINWHSCFFLLFALVACGAAVAVVVSSHVVRMAFYLIVALAAVAGLFFLAGADFLGAMQIMIYVGGTVVLLAFGVMLTAHTTLVSLNTGADQWILAAFIAASLLAVLLQAGLTLPPTHPDVNGAEAQADAPPATSEVQPTASPLGMALLGFRTDTQPGENPSGYLLPFEIVSVHLLVALIGAAYLARAKSRRNRDAENQPTGPQPQAKQRIASDDPG